MRRLLAIAALALIAALHFPLPATAEVTSNFGVTGIFNPAGQGATSLRGTATNDSAAAGNLGEYISASASSVSFGTSGTIGDLASISLTAGDWDVTGIINYNAAATTVCDTQSLVGISTTSGNSGTGLVSGDNMVFGCWVTGNGTTLVVPAYRVSIAATTTYYLKYRATYSVASGNMNGRISARRVR